MPGSKSNVSIMSCVAIAVSAICAAQQPAIKRTELQRGDLSVAGREAVTSLAEFPVGAQIGRHTHPGEEISYVLEGSLSVEVDGQPAVTKNAGEVFMIPAGVVHNGRNAGSGVTKVVATHVVEKGKPITTLVK
jgi:quercetin dioxygenase-like cupin family protein